MFKVLAFILFSLFILSCSDDLNVKDVKCNYEGETEGCPTNAVCEKEVCVLKTDLEECSSDSDCDDKFYCDTDYDRCRDNSCMGDIDCDEQEYCTDSKVCEYLCNDSNDCKDESKPLCNEDGECVACMLNCGDHGICEVNVTGTEETEHCICSEGYVVGEDKSCIEDSTCIPDCTDKSCGGDGCGGTCGACESTQDCLKEENSDTYSCVNKEEVITCTNSTDCQSNETKKICNVNTCVGCLEDSDCSEDNKICDKEGVEPSYECIFDSKIWLDVSVGEYHTCAITSEEKLYCWGNNSQGQLGIGDNVGKNAPQLVEGIGWISVSTGKSHTCAIKKEDTNNVLYCWGSNLSGELGISDKSNKNTPQKVSYGDINDSWTDISSGRNYTCGINEGRLYCWGAFNSGELGLGNINDSTVIRPTIVKKVMNETGDLLNLNTEVWSLVSTSFKHTCGNLVSNNGSIDEAGLYCWGTNSSMKIGTPSLDTVYNTPIKISLNEWSNISLGLNNTCGVMENKTYCWGSNSKGQLGDNDPIGDYRAFDKNKPIENLNNISMSFMKVYSGVDYSCAITVDKMLHCWGQNPNNQFASDSVEIGNYNYSIPTGLTVSKISLNRFATTFHSCFIKNGELYCWGNNTKGQLGLGIDTSSILNFSLVTMP